MPADVECPATPPEMPLDATPTRVKLSPSREGSGSPGRASPDSACPICLGKLDNKAFSDGCMHQFCFTCIVEWSKVRAVCPLCKQAFTSIIHNVRSELDYDRYRLPPPPPAVDPQNPYIYQPGDGAESRSRWLQMRRQQYRYRSLVLPMLWPVPEGHDYHLPAAPARPRPQTRARLTSDSRRRLYGSDMWARPTPDELTGRYRETGPDFYRNNPACTHRLVPWLNRELNAVLDSPVHLAHVMEQIMELITHVHILSPEFRAHLQPYMSPWTEHFVHELYCYARSPYDMVGYDLHVQYRTGQPEAPPTQVMASSSSDSDSGSDSDIRVLTPPPRVPTPMLVEPPSSPEAGPSGNGGAAAERGVCAALGRVRAFLATARAAEEAASDSDSESPVEVVEVVPPRQERSPVVVTLSSDEEPPPPPPPQTAAQLEAERRRAARRVRYAAMLTEEKKKRQTQQRRDAAEERQTRRRDPAEERVRTREDRAGKRRKRDKAAGAAGTAADPAGAQKQSSSRAAKSRDERQADRAERRPQREDEGRAAKSNQSSSKSKSSKVSVSTTGSLLISKSKSTATSSVSSKSSDASWKQSTSERSSVTSIVSLKSSDRMTIEIVGETTDRSSSNSNSRSRSVTSATAETVDDKNAKSSAKSGDRSHKSKSSDRSLLKPKSSDRSHKSKSSDKGLKSKSSDRSHKSKPNDKSHKSKHRDKSGKSKSSDKHNLSGTKSGKSRHKRDSAERRHKKRSRDDSRRHKRSRLDGGPPDGPGSPAVSAAPTSPQPSTSSGVTSNHRLFHRIVMAPSSPSEAVSSSSSSVVGVPVRAARVTRCRRLSDSSNGGSEQAGRLVAMAVSDCDSDSDSDGEVRRRPAVRSAVARAQGAAVYDSSDW